MHRTTTQGSTSWSSKADQNLATKAVARAERHGPAAAEHALQIGVRHRENTALFLSLHRGGWWIRHRIRMVCTMGPSRLLSDPKETIECP